MCLCHILGNSDSIHVISEEWVMGDSIPYFAGQRAELRGMPDLNFAGEAWVAWMGVCGKRWEDADAAPRSLPGAFKCISSPPGDNDLVRQNLQVQFKRIQRRLSRDPKTESKAIINKMKWYNQFGHNMMHTVKWDVSKMDIDLEPPILFRNDGVHLYDVGLVFGFGSRVFIRISLKHVIEFGGKLILFLWRTFYVLEVTGSI